MPAPIIPDQGKTTFMDLVVPAIDGGTNTAKIRLFQNNYTPVTGTVIAALTEATFGGYAGVSTPVATDSGVIPGGVDNWIFGSVTFTATGATLPQTIYGYWVECVDPLLAATKILWAQRFDTPQALTAAGQTISFVLSLAGTQG